MSGIEAELLLVRAQGILFCAALREVQRIIPLPAVQPVPGAPAYLQGVMDLAGECLPVIDLARRLGLAHALPYRLDTPLLVCRSGGECGVLVVDEVLGVIAPGPADRQLSALFDGGLPAFRAGLRTAEGLALLLDLRRVLHLDLAIEGTELAIPESLIDACRAAGAA